MFRRIRAWVVVLFRGSRFRRELEEEMAFHIRCLAEDLIRGGMDPKRALREAKLRFGSRERVQSKSREARGLAWVDEVVRNFRFALRGLVRGPLFAGTFLLTLALCIGFGTAVFSIVDAVLWRPLPYPDPDKLAHAVLYDPASGKSPGNTSVDGRTWELLRDEGQPVEMAVYSGWVRGVNLSTGAAAIFIGQQRVGAGYFRTLGVPPQMGREFGVDEDVPGGPPVAILSHDLWTGTFSADPDILGTTIRLKGEAHTVVGIMPATYRSPADADVWTPLRPSTQGEGGGTNYAILIRVPTGMSMEEADGRLASVRLPASDPGGVQDRRFGLVPLSDVQTAGVRMPLLVLLGAIGLMLVVGCANLASLQIARSVSRRAEMATRQALGSGTRALVRQMVAENVVLGALGGLAGLGVCLIAVEGLESLVHTHLGTWQDVRVDGRVLGAAFGLSTLATILFGVVPVLQVRRSGLHRILVSGSRGLVGKGGHLLRKTLLVCEVAVVTALLFAAGLLVRSYGYLGGMNPGFEPSGVLTVQFSLDDARYAEGEEVQRLFSETLTNVRGLPGVESASAALTLPYQRPLNLPFRLPGDDEQTNRLTNAVYVTPGFFETLGIPVLRGRVFEEGDGANASLVGVANQAFVDEHFEGRAALGTPVNMGFGGGEGVEIVGVVGNVLQQAGWGDAATPIWETPTLYLASAQASDAFLQQIHVWFSPSWIVKATRQHPEFAAQVTRAFSEVAPDLPIARVASLTGVMDEAFATERFEALFLVLVAGFALLLAGIGLYGIVAQEALERSPEMGLRMALGATPVQAIWATGANGVFLTATGLVLGAFLTLPVGRLMVSLIYGIKPSDPTTLVFLVATLALFSVVASFVPSLKVGRMDPGSIMRDG